MNSCYIFSLFSDGLGEIRKNGKTFCIGVKNRPCSLEKLQEKFPELLITREKEVCNTKYIMYDEDERNQHILQPAWLEMATSEQVPPVAAAKAASPKTTKGK